MNCFIRQPDGGERKVKERSERSDENVTKGMTLALCDKSSFALCLSMVNRLGDQHLSAIWDVPTESG